MIKERLFKSKHVSVGQIIKELDRLRKNKKKKVDKAKKS
jgi:cyclophilin family peptidyl-prolyl cis-trans isomerase